MHPAETHRNADHDADIDPDQYSDRDTDLHSDRYTHTGAYFNSNGDPDRHADRDTTSDTHRNGDLDADGYPHIDSDHHADSHPAPRMADVSPESPTYGPESLCSPLCAGVGVELSNRVPDTLFLPCARNGWGNLYRVGR